MIATIINKKRPYENEDGLEVMDVKVIYRGNDNGHYPTDITIPSNIFSLDKIQIGERYEITFDDNGDVRRCKDECAYQFERDFFNWYYDSLICTIEALSNAEQYFDSNSDIGCRIMEALETLYSILIDLTVAADAASSVSLKQAN